MTERKKRFVRWALSSALTTAVIYSMAAASYAQAVPEADSPLVTVTEMWRCEGEAESGQAESAAPRSHEPEAHPEVYIGGEKFEGYVFINTGTTYVPLKAFSDKLGGAEISHGEDGTAHMTLGENSESFTEDEGFIIDGKMYVPIRRVAEFYGLSVRWSAADFAVYVNEAVAAAKTVPAPAPKYTEDELYWLSRIIHAEAKGESMTGKIAVGNVVLNRVESELFPATIYGVIFDFKDGVQFTPAANGSVYEAPSAESVEAAKQCLSGVNVVGDALFFMNSRIAESSWIKVNREYLMTIGNHEFYA